MYLRALQGHGTATGAWSSWCAGAGAQRRKLSWHGPRQVALNIRHRRIHGLLQARQRCRLILL